MATEKRLIDANEAIERAKKSDEIVWSSIWETSEVVDFLEDCPIVDAVEVVHGRWDNLEGDPMWQKCSACGFVVQYSYSKDCNYCPNCGAKMDGDGNA